METQEQPAKARPPSAKQQRRSEKQKAVRAGKRICGWYKCRKTNEECRVTVLDWLGRDETKKPQQMAICDECRSRLEGEPVACVHCGKHVDGGDQVVCTACHENQARELFVCSGCGEKIDGKRLLCRACFVKRNADVANSNEAPSPRTRSQQPQVKSYFRWIKDKG